MNEDRKMRTRKYEAPLFDLQSLRRSGVQYLYTLVLRHSISRTYKFENAFCLGFRGRGYIRPNSLARDKQYSYHKNRTF